MSDTPLTFTDAIIMAVILASAFLALLRGCVRETLAVSAWVLSAFIAYAIYFAGGQTLTLWITGHWFIHTLFILVVFAGLVALFTMANRKILAQIGSGEKVPLWDQIAGFCFGFLRGLALVAILFQAHVLVYGPKETPRWLTEARLFPLVAATANVLKVALPGPITTPSAPEKSGRSATVSERGQSKQTKTATGSDDKDGTGYSKDERQAIDRLVRNKLDPR